MKSIAYIFLVGGTLFMSSCSTCYECTEERIQYDANYKPLDTTYVSDEFCTADQEEVKAREDEGADCRVQ